jgi:hypothetical protein
LLSIIDKLLTTNYYYFLKERFEYKAMKNRSHMQ